MSLLVLSAAIAIGVSFLCSVLEAALLSITPSYVARQKEERPRLHDALRRLKERIDQPLAAILTTNTVAHTAGATAVGAQVAVVFGEAWVGAASAIMTLLILVLSEILPKTLGVRYWPRLAPLLPPVLNVMIVLLRPFIWLSDLLTRLLGGGAPATDIRAELKAMAAVGREVNVLDESEQRVIVNLIDLHRKTVREIMVPRAVCVWARPDEPLDVFRQRLKKCPYSRFPVVGEGEQPEGQILARTLVHLPAGARVVADVLRPVTVVNDTCSVEDAMETMIGNRQPLCLVYDEYGTWQGLVTLEDTVEALLGRPIMDEEDRVIDMRRFAQARWEHRRRALARRNTRRP